MNQVQQSRDSFSPDLEGNAQIGYQTATALWISEGQQIWARFNTMLVVNSIIVAVISAILAGQRSLPVLAVSLPLAGLIVCAVWFILMKRDFEYQSYLIYSAREMEEQYLRPVETISRGGPFVRGEVVELMISGAPVKRRMSWVSRSFRDRTVAYVVILVFAILYIVMLFER